MHGQLIKKVQSVCIRIVVLKFSFVLRGKINHFDTKQNKWIPLSKGDVQIIRAGNGISHAEELEKILQFFKFGLTLI